MKQSLLKFEKLLPKDAVAIISSNSLRRASYDQFYPFVPNKDLLYLTGITSQDCCLIVPGDGSQKILLLKKKDPHKALWDGHDDLAKLIAQKLPVKIIEVDKITDHCFEYIKGFKELFYQPIEGTTSLQVAKTLLGLLGFERRNYPQSITHLDVLMAPLRQIKSPEDLEKVKKAIDITAASLEEVSSQIHEEMSERFLADTIEYYFKAFGGSLAFSTIVASGESASTLHHSPSTSRKINDNKLLLIDCGASFNEYCADVTRTFSVAPEKTSQHLHDLYSIVLTAQQAAIEEVKDGVLIKKVYDAAAKELITGLISLKVLKKAPVQKIIQSGALKEFFPHGIGHSLGLDTHDIGETRGNNEAVLKAGMVFTIEPGLYFQKPFGKIPRCGVRIEDNVYVTKKGCEVLTDMIPK